MAQNNNPFEYEQATKFTDEEIIDYYIEDFNYGRFIHSRRNVFLVGERGTGKTMALLYHALPVQILLSKAKEEKIKLDLIPVYIPCNTPLTHRQEYKLLPSVKASLVSEHFFVFSIMHAIITAIVKADVGLVKEEQDKLLIDLEFILNIKFPDNHSTFEAILLALERVNVQAQESLNSREDDPNLTNLLSFNSGLHPLLATLRRVDIFSKSHFSLMIDDAQLLNEYQIKLLNSWIAYRDNDLFSFKVTTTRVDAPTYATAAGGSILEDHDFIRLDMERPYQNNTSDFGRLSRDIIEKRLQSIGVDKSPEEFFPIDPAFERDMQEAKEKTLLIAKEKYPDGSSKQISDYVYKYTRANYFKERSPRANLPRYSGFDTLVHLSTGVIRNLLGPCYYMYDRIYSEKRSNRSQDIDQIKIEYIPPTIQNEIIQDRSRRKWEYMLDDLSRGVEGCSLEEAKYVHQLLDNLAILFKKRLHSNISEPRAVVFTISSLDEGKHSHLMDIITIARRAQLMYTYMSAAKELGKREIYIVPNRILWPQRGLDPIGQHARVSIKADYLLKAAIYNKQIPFGGDSSDAEIMQLDNFQ